MIQSHDDPTLDELLGDPITQAIMTADRVDPPQLEAMLRSIARAVGGRSGASATALVEAASARFGLRDTACCMSGSSARSRHCEAP